MTTQQQTDLLNKLARQNTAAGINTVDGSPLPDSANVSHEDLIEPLDNVQNEHVRQMRQTGAQITVPINPAQTPPAQPVQSTPTHVAPTPEQAPVAPVIPSTQPDQDVTGTSMSIRNRIAEIEQELGEASPAISTRAAAFLDELGNETFYVENISNGHIAISDLGVTIKRGTSQDLLWESSLEQVKNSRDLRAMLARVTDRPLLKRLTPEEFLYKKEIELQNKRRIEQMKANPPTEGTQAQPRPRIRPTVLSKLEKLRLSTEPKSAHLGMTPIEFVQWVVTETLTAEELDFISTHPNVVNNVNGKEIIQNVFERKGQILNQSF